MSQDELLDSLPALSVRGGQRPGFYHYVGGGGDQSEDDDLSMSVGPGLVLRR